VNHTSFREFHGLLKSKSRKKNFKPFCNYIDFGKVLKKCFKRKFFKEKHKNSQKTALITVNGTVRVGLTSKARRTIYA
jgi:hypothetical protein